MIRGPSQSSSEMEQNTENVGEGKINKKPDCSLSGIKLRSII